jgi:hypothetical protein
MSGNGQNALNQELLAAALRCESSLWFCQTCQEVVFYDRRMQEPLGVHESHQALPIPTLFDPDEGCERGFLRGWIETDASLSTDRRMHLLDALELWRADTEEFLLQVLAEDERETYERYRSDQAEAIVVELF